MKLVGKFLLSLLGLDECYDPIISICLARFESARIVNNNSSIRYVRYWHLDVVLSTTVTADTSLLIH